MTDLETSKALALAIGWHKDAVATHTDMWEVMVHAQRNPFGWEVFNYRDWNVIGPIAEKYNCFPQRIEGTFGNEYWWAYSDYLGDGYGDTPQKAIAMAVVGAKK